MEWSAGFGGRSVPKCQHMISVVATHVCNISGVRLGAYLSAHGRISVQVKRVASQYSIVRHTSWLNGDETGDVPDGGIGRRTTLIPDTALSTGCFLPELTVPIGLFEGGVSFVSREISSGGNTERGTTGSDGF